MWQIRRKAWQYTTSEIDEEAAAHAMLLQEVMYQNGFTGYSGEWWDYSDTVTYTEVDDFVPGSY